jgi:hypothetical protein
MMRYLSIIALCLISSCSSEKPSTKTIRDNFHGIDFILEHVEGPVLSLSEDRVYVKRGSDRTLIFEGYGGKNVELRNYGDSIIVIEYCHGSIRKVDSVLSKSRVSGNAIAIKIQPVIAVNVQFDGVILCPE